MFDPTEQQLIDFLTAVEDITLGSHSARRYDIPRAVQVSVARRLLADPRVQALIPTLHADCATRCGRLAPPATPQWVNEAHPPAPHQNGR